MLDLLQAMCATFMSTNPSQMKRFELAQFIIDGSGDGRRAFLESGVGRYDAAADHVEKFVWLEAMGALLETMDRDDSELTYTTRDLRDVFIILRVNPGSNFDGPVLDAPVVDQTVVGVAACVCGQAYEEIERMSKALLSIVVAQPSHATWLPVREAPQSPQMMRVLLFCSHTLLRSPRCFSTPPSYHRRLSATLKAQSTFL